jgi:hypothetical protein
MKINRENESLVSRAELKQIIHYDCSTGIVSLKDLSGKYNLSKNNGYIVVNGICGKVFRAHRLVWFYHYGVWPDNLIDHINGIKTDNRIVNLRDVSNRVNGQNRKKAKKRDNNLPNGVSASRYNKFGDVLSYVVAWRDIESKQCRKQFPISRYGTEETTIDAASDYFNMVIDKLNSQGAAYTERHGLEI